MLSVEFPGEAAGRNRPCRQVCEGDEDEGPRFGLRAEMVRRASEEETEPVEEWQDVG